MGLSLQIPKLAPRSTNPAKRPTAQRSSSSSSSTIVEALRTNPFGTSRAKNSNATLAQDIEADRIERNKALLVLVRLFPDIQAEVARELLTRFDGDSQLEICAEQLLRHREGWVKGRLKVPPYEGKEPLPVEDYFRAEGYKNATKAVLGLEFRSLSRSTIDAVLAEENFSYTRARPKLKDLSKKTWRATLNNLNIFRKRRESDDLPASLLAQNGTAENPILKETASEELNVELRGLYVSPLLEQRKEAQEVMDQAYAEAVNRQESEEAENLFECQVCYNDVPFESISSCSDGGHIICFDCIRHTLQEAVFGQGWGKSVDAKRATLKCIAPVVSHTCEGYLPADVIRRAIESSKAGKETWRKFEDHLASQVLLKAQIPLVHCPFCSYAEVDLHPYQNRGIPWHFNPSCPLPLLLFLLPFIVGYCLIITILTLLGVPHLSPFQRSLINVTLRNRSPLFICLNTSCLRRSCLKCFKPWHDPHICHEPLLQSLRTTVEAARTAAVKRTCPRCGLSFVKASGCNKLTCVCGYAMCYICRKAISTPNGRGSIRRGGENENEGYRHFCEHFRPVPGKPCTQCTKCDLYRAEDEEGLVREAGERAEREWREKEGMLDVQGFGVLPGDENASSSTGQSLVRTLLRGDWSFQKVMDWGVERTVKVEE